MNFQIIAKERGILEQEKSSYLYLSHDEVQFSFADAPLQTFNPSFYSSNESQQLFFNQNVQQLIDSALLQDAPQLILAMGLESSGKTYTVEGISSMPSQQGMVPRIVDYLLQEQAEQISYNCIAVTFQQFIYDLSKSFDPLSKISPNFNRDLPVLNSQSIKSSGQFIEITAAQRENSKMLRSHLKQLVQNELFHKIHIISFIIQERRGTIALVDAQLFGVNCDKQLKTQLQRIFAQLKRNKALSRQDYSLNSQISVSKGVSQIQKLQRSGSTQQSQTQFISTREHKLTNLLRGFFKSNAFLTIIFCVAPTHSYQNHRFDIDFLASIFQKGKQMVGGVVGSAIQEMAQSKLQEQSQYFQKSRSRLNDQIQKDIILYNSGVRTKLTENELVVEPQNSQIANVYQPDSYLAMPSYDQAAAQEYQYQDPSVKYDNNYQIQQSVQDQIAPQQHAQQYYQHEPQVPQIIGGDSSVMLLNELRTQLEYEKTKNKQMEATNEQIKQSLLQEAKKTVRDKLEKQQQVIRHLEDTVVQRDDQIHDLNVTIDQFQQSLNYQAQQQEYISSLGTATKTQVEQNIDKTQISELQLIIAQITKQLTEKTDHIINLETKLDQQNSLVNELQQLKFEKVDQGNRLGKLQTDYDKAKDSCQLKQQEIESYVKQISILQARQQVYQEKIEDMDLIKADCVTKTYENDKIKKELNEYKYAIWDAEKEVQEIKLINESLQVDKENLLKECQLLRQYAGSQITRVEEQ